MKTGRLFIAVTAILFALAVDAFAYQAALKAEASKDAVGKGETFTYKLSITEEGEADKVAALEPLDFGVFRVSGTFATSNVKVIQGKARRVTEQEYRLSTDTPGTHVIPSAVLDLTDPKTGEVQKMDSNEVTVVVSEDKKGVIQGLEDDIRDIREPKTLMDRIKLYFYVVVALAIICLLILVGFVMYVVSKKKKAAPQVAPPVSALSAREQALREIADAERSRTDTQTYYTLVTDAVRRYLMAARGLHAMEATTSEIMVQAKKLQVTPDAVERLGSLFMEADMVKFARYAPDEAEKAAFADKARRLVGEI